MPERLRSSYPSWMEEIHSHKIKAKKKKRFFFRTKQNCNDHSRFIWQLSQQLWSADILSLLEHNGTKAPGILPRIYDKKRKYCNWVKLSTLGYRRKHPKTWFLRAYLWASTWKLANNKTSPELIHFFQLPSPCDK